MLIVQTSICLGFAVFFAILTVILYQNRNIYNNYFILSLLVCVICIILASVYATTPTPTDDDVQTI